MVKPSDNRRPESSHPVRVYVRSCHPSHKPRSISKTTFLADCIISATGAIPSLLRPKQQITQQAKVAPVNVLVAIHPEEVALIAFRIISRPAVAVLNDGDITEVDHAVVVEIQSRLTVVGDFVVVAI